MAYFIEIDQMHLMYCKLASAYTSAIEPESIAMSRIIRHSSIGVRSTALRVMFDCIKLILFNATRTMVCITCGGRG